MKIDIEEIIKKEITQFVSNKIEEEIDKKVEDFKYELIKRKDNYIAEVMKGIRVYQEQQMGSLQQNYVITFENIFKLESQV